MLDAHVLVRDDAQVGGNFLAAYVVPTDRRPVRPRRTNSAPTLPATSRAYMLPSAYVHLPALPLNRSGKVDQRALPAPDRQPAADRLVAPASALEARLAEIWREVLKVDRVGVEDSFFDLGGHSLLLAAGPRPARSKRWSRPLPLVKLFEHPTIRSLARTSRELRRPRPRSRTGGAQLRAGRARLNRRASISTPTTQAPTTQGGNSHVR